MPRLKSKSSFPPFIGISTRWNTPREIFYLQPNYSQAIHAAGGTPVLVPLIPDKNLIRNLVDVLDGIMLSGSAGDVGPHHYGARKHQKCGEVQPVRDETDFLLLEEVFKRKLPVLAICFGIQSLNVFLGGTLIQDIPSQCPGALTHSLEAARPSRKNPEGFCSHPVHVERDSLLFELAGRKAEAHVNSSHHQALDRVARDLKITARAPDDIIEAVELKFGSHFVFGTQWHPEKGFERDSLSQAIFKRFVIEARRHSMETS